MPRTWSKRVDATRVVPLVAALIRRLLVALLGVLVAAGALEIGARGFVSGGAGAPRPREILPLYRYERDADLGYWFRPSSRYRAAKGFSTTDLCYAATYSFDAYGRRTVAASTPTARTVALFGDSFAFGEGLEDGDTLQAMLQARGVAVANYSAPGFGPQHALAAILSGRVARETDHAAIGLYLLMPFHVRRAIGDSSHPWLWGGPYFRFDGDGRLVRDGSFKTGRRWTTRVYREYDRLRKRSAALGWLDTALPPVLRERDVELTAAILVEAARGFEKDFRGRFSVVLHPWWTTATRERWTLDALRMALARDHVDVIDLADEPVSEQDQIRPGCDGHPNRAFGARFVERLAPLLDSRFDAATPRS